MSQDVKERPDARDGETPWSFLGLRIDRKTEIIALAAFALSISGVLWQVVNFTRGAVVRLFPSDQVVIASTSTLGRTYSGDEPLLMLIATMSYVNDGDTGHNAVIRKEKIEFTLSNRTFEHQWYEFVSSDVRDGKLEVKKDSEARPFPVNAGSANSHETLFTAWEIFCDPAQKSCDPGANFITWKAFLEAIRKSPTIAITTTAEVYSRGAVSASCVIRLRDWEVADLEKDQFLSAACSAADDGARARPPGRSGPKTH